LLLAAGPVTGDDAEDEASIPVIMEEAVVQGTVVKLEDKDNDRALLAEVPVVLWSDGKGRRIYETKTDKDGRFAIPRVTAGDYIIAVGTVNLRLRVRPPTGDPEKDLEAPKVIYILIPKDVV
jgi:hypothetical protein